MRSAGVLLPVCTEAVCVGSTFLLRGVPSSFTACAGSRSALAAAATTTLVPAAKGAGPAAVRCICLLRVESWQG
jgi:hypothetical protein